MALKTKITTTTISESTTRVHVHVFDGTGGGGGSFFLVHVFLNYFVEDLAVDQNSGTPRPDLVEADNGLIGWHNQVVPKTAEGAVFEIDLDWVTFEETTLVSQAVEVAGRGNVRSSYVLAAPGGGGAQAFHQQHQARAIRP